MCAGGATQLTWLPCGNAAGNATTVTTHVVNNLLWRPSSGVAGYVGGVQCDVWPDGAGISRDGNPYPFVSQPFMKFRLPMALAQTPKGAAKALTT